jgi:hypothetical protein
MSFFAGVASVDIMFILSLVFRKKLAKLIQRIKLPKWLLYFITAAILIIPEEQIDCQKTWCGRILIPPTLLPLLLFMFFLFVGVKLLHAKTASKPTIIFSILGIAFEKTFGGLAGVPLTPFIVLFFMPYVGIGYALITLIPLTVLLE